MTGEEDLSQEDESNTAHHDPDVTRSGIEVRPLQGNAQEAQLTVHIPAAQDENTSHPGSAWSSSSEEEEDMEEICDDAEHENDTEAQEAVITEHKTEEGEQPLVADISGGRPSDNASDHADKDATPRSIDSAVAVGDPLEDETDLFSDFDGAWSDDESYDISGESAEDDGRGDVAVEEVGPRPRLRTATLEDNDADDESSPVSPSLWRAQEELALERRPHLRGRRLSITDQYKDLDLRRGRGNIETAAKRAMHRIDKKFDSLAAYERPHEGGERMGDPRVKAHLRPGEHVNTPRKPSPLRRYESEKAIVNETDVAEPRSPDCVLLPRPSDEERRGWADDDTRRALKRKWRQDATDQIMPEDVETTSNRLAELLNEDSAESVELDHTSLAVLISACQQASTSDDTGLRLALLVSDRDAESRQFNYTRTASRDLAPRLDIPLRSGPIQESSEEYLVSPISSDADEQGQSPLPTSAQELVATTGMTTEGALAAAEEWNRRCDEYPLSEPANGTKPKDAGERLAKKRTKAVFEWDFEDYLLRRQGLERQAPLRLPEDPRERAEFARAMAHFYRYERDEARRKVSFLFEEAQHVQRLRGERDKLRRDMSDYQKAIGQNFTEVAALEQKLRQKCQRCGLSSDNHIDNTPAGDTVRCLDSRHAELEQEVTAARERIQALEGENGELEASLEKRKAKMAELKQHTLTWKQKADAAQAQAEQVQELADCELRRRAYERCVLWPAEICIIRKAANFENRVYTSSGTDPADSTKQEIDDSTQELQRQYDELAAEHRECRQRLEQKTQDHHDDLRKSGDNQRELRAAMDQLESQRAALESQLKRLASDQRTTALPDTRSASTTRPFTPPDRLITLDAVTPSMIITRPTPPKIDVDVNSTLSADEVHTTSVQTPCTPGLTAFLDERPPSTPAIERSESWHERNAKVMESSTYLETTRKLQACRQEQRKAELRAKKYRDQAYFDLFGESFQPVTESEKKKIYYGIAHQSRRGHCEQQQRGGDKLRAQERIKQRSSAETTYHEDNKARLSAARDDYNARSPTKPYRVTTPDHEDNQANLQRRLWGGAQSPAPLEASRTLPNAVPGGPVKQSGLKRKLWGV